MSNFQQTVLRSAKRSKFTRYIAVVLVVVLVGFVAKKTVFSKQNKATPIRNTISKTIDLDTNLDIPLGSESEEKISYRITKAELTDSAIIKGQKAKPSEGKIFLLLSVKLSNKHSRRVTLNSRDYIRLAIGDSEERHPPAMYNDPIEVQPISDQETRLGFSIDKTDSTLKLLVGEVEGDKTEVVLNFE